MTNSWARRMFSLMFLPLMKADWWGNSSSTSLSKILYIFFTSTLHNEIGLNSPRLSPGRLKESWVDLVLTAFHFDCLLLLDKFNRRISNWKGKLLSYAGRMELISSVLASLHIYWSSAFRLPEKDLEIHFIEHSGFLLVRPRTRL
jgi:hypothetical protein